MKCEHDELHANKSEKLRSFENTVKNIFDEKLKKFGDDCFEKAKNLENVTHVQIFDNYGNYYFKKVNNNFRDTLREFDIKGRHLNNVKNFNSLRKEKTKKKKISLLHSVYPI